MKAARIYAQKFGWRVLPVRPGGKVPAISEWTKAASADAAQVDAWVAEFPDANIGVATGDGSGIFILDVDPRNGGDETLERLVEQHGELPRTPQQATPSGGAHFVFRHVPGLRNSAQQLGAGLDIRAEGGQFVVAPSRAPTGVYRWVHAPWDVPVADAPEWLLELLRPQPAAVAAAPTSRGYFPPAPAEVLQQARDALDAHGPAVEGEGGDDHTFKAAALLIHDFALTDDEAWPLFQEWNETCEPPWDEDALDAKLRGGLKYGKHAYGCKRTLDGVEIVKKWVADWQTSGAGEPEMIAMLERCQRLTFDNPAKRALVERELVAATGLKVRALGLQKVSAAAVTRPAGSIEITTRPHEVADLALKAMAPDVFQRNGVLCEVVRAPDRTFISELEPARIVDLMSRTAKYYRVDEKASLVAQTPPPNVAAILHARRAHPRVRVLESVTTAPVFLGDGSILQERGYNAEARVFLEPSVTVDVPDAPTRADARAAVAVFADMLCGFKFHSRADFSSWLAGLLSPLVKASTGNAPSPLICVSASSAGAGKSLLTDVIALVVTGEKAQMRPYKPKDPAEWAKSLTSFVRAASPVSVLDNCNGPIGDEGLDRLITSSTWSDRILGASDAIPLPNVSTWFATGNNIEPVNDTVRRVLMVRIEVDTERPQERQGFRYDLEGGYAGAHRAELLSAALTILRAYHVAGRPAQELPSWGSFSTWSALVRGALVWAGCADPFQTQQRAASDLDEPEHTAHDFWISVITETDGAAASVAALANQRDAQNVLGLRDNITALHLKRFVGRFVDKPRAGRRIRREGGTYRVEPIT